MVRRQLEPLAGEIQRQLGLDPMTIAIIVQAIIAALELIQDCRSAGMSMGKVRATMVLSLGRRRLRRQIIRDIGSAELNRIGGEDFLDAIIRRATELTDESLENLVDDLRSYDL